MLRADITILFSMISSSSSVISCLFSDSVLRLGVDFRRILVKVEAVSRIVDDSGAVFLRKDTFAHDPVTVCGARLQACHCHLVECSDRFPAGLVFSFSFCRLFRRDFA